MCLVNTKIVGKPLLIISLLFTAGTSTITSQAVPNARALAKSYIFVSANTRSHMTDEDARQSFDSFEQENAIAVADHIACTLTQSVRIADVLGVYAKDSENSLVIETDLKAEVSQYLASLLGRYAHQEFVLSFTRQDHGPDKIWVIDTDHPPAEVVKDLRDSNLVPATVRDDHGRTELLFVEFGSGLTEKLRMLGSNLYATISTADGLAAMRGNDDRLQAAAIFDANIRDVEKQGRYRLSSHLWTKEWHDATSRTCSAQFSGTN